MNLLPTTESEDMFEKAVKERSLVSMRSLDDEIGPKRVNEFNKILRSITSDMESKARVRSENHNNPVEGEHKKRKGDSSLDVPHNARTTTSRKQRPKSSVITMGNNRVSQPGSQYYFPKQMLRQADIDMGVLHLDGIDDHKRDIYKWLKVGCKEPNIRKRVRAKIVSILNDVVLV